MAFPAQRLRRLRRTPTLRRMVREARLSVDDIIYPLFVVHGRGIREEIQALPGNYHLSLDLLAEEVQQARELGIPAVLLFGIPERRDTEASESYAPDGIVQQAVRVVRESAPDMAVITDVCLCEYTEHGHCGIIKDGYLDNDESLRLLARVAVSHARAGSDLLAPAAMLDGQIATMRGALDEEGLGNTGIISYAAKFASVLYDPFFREGTHSMLAFGDKRTHQMDPGNGDEALREIALDIDEGADIIMVKPAMTYLDVLWRARSRFAVPLAVYNVSGEYAMIAGAAQGGRMDQRRAMYEVMTSFKRAGANLIVTYFAKQLAADLREGRFD